MRRDGIPTRRPSRRVGAWSPEDIGGLALWLDNSLITEAAGVVTAWPDLSRAGNHFTQASPSNQPTYVASETDFPTPQPAVKFDVNVSRLGCPNSVTFAWVAVVAVYPATTFAAFNILMSRDASGTGDFLVGSSGTANWATSGAALSGTRHRNGEATDVALTTANVPHLYEFRPTTPAAGAPFLGGRSSLAWSDSVCLVLAATAVPDAATRLKLLAYVRERGMVP